MSVSSRQLSDLNTLRVGIVWMLATPTRHEIFVHTELTINLNSSSFGFQWKGGQLGVMRKLSRVKPRM